jgi:hypothetical protein
MPDEPEYPPQFASSDLSSLLGQINDFAGMPPPPPPPAPMEMRSAKSAKNSSSISSETSRLTSADGYAVPVSIVGSQAQRGPYLPGLKDILIGVTYLRLAEQITSPELKATAQKMANELMQTGNSTLGSHLAKQQRAVNLRKK